MGSDFSNYVASGSDCEQVLEQGAWALLGQALGSGEVGSIGDSGKVLPEMGW